MTRLLALTIVLLAASPALAHKPGDPPHQTYPMGDLKLESGEAIKDFAISYVTHGTLNAKKSNAILMVTALTGNHHRLDFLIGPGKALDTTKYFVVATDAIGNGLTTSPSNSKAQPRMQFPKFGMRDMVESQRRLLGEKLGIDHVVAVVGPSMGGMQALQWGVSHADFMDGLVALVPLARTPAWSAVIVEMYRDQFANPLDVLPWLKTQEDAVLSVFDPNDYIYQSWAYESHDVGATPGMSRDYAKALRAIKAKTLIMTGVKDLLNPEWEPLEAARHIRDVRTVTISPESVTGHFAAGGFRPADVEQINTEVATFLDVVTRAGERLR